MREIFCTSSGIKGAAWCVVAAMLILAPSSFSGESDGATNATTRITVRKPAAKVSVVGTARHKSSEVGVASYYSDRYHGKQTASGETFDMHQLTAAHPRYKFGTRVKVTHLGNNCSVIVRINDRGPFIAGRAIDLSLAAAEELQMVKAGLAEVKLEIVE